jgi:hypothetical protein
MAVAGKAKTAPLLDDKAFLCLYAKKRPIFVRKKEFMDKKILPFNWATELKDIPGIDSIDNDLILQSLQSIARVVRFASCWGIPSLCCQ